MKKIIQVIIGSLFVFVFSFNLVFSAPNPNTQDGGSGPAPTTSNTQTTTTSTNNCKVDKFGVGTCPVAGSPNALKYENYKCAGNGGEVITIPSCIVGGIFDPKDPEDVKCACCGECRISRFVGMVVLVSKFILGASGVIALVIIIYGGFMWILSAGDSQKVEKGKGALTGAVIGVIIILVSWVVINFLLNVLVQDKSLRDNIKENNAIEGLQRQFKADSK